MSTENGIAIGAPEIVTQKHVIKLLEGLGYTYLGDLSEKPNENVIGGILGAYLKKRGYSEHLIKGALADLHDATCDLSQGLYEANKKVYQKIRSGCNVKDADGSYKDVKIVDFTDPMLNDFHVAEEVTVSCSNFTKRPDLVLYVNGIAMGVIELKKSSVSILRGISQNINNQKELFIRQFFTTMQLVCAGNTSEGLRYGTVETDATHYLEWKPDGFTQHEDERNADDVAIDAEAETHAEKLDRQIAAMFSPRRFLALVRDFMIFDRGIKKVCRYSQYYGVRRAMNRLPGKEGGIIWHSQGSGKSLTMVWLSKLILESNPNARVLIVTDREELDDQIEKLYIGVDVNIVRAKKCAHLIEMIGAVDGGRMMCSLVHKFGHKGADDEGASEKDVKKYVEDLKASLPEGFEAKGDFTVFVDECHRSHSGILHQAMKTILPNAVLVGFTGTPLLKKDKKTSLEVFGPYIHTYKFPEAVRDRVVLDLHYEARDIPQEITAKTQIDAWFEAKTSGLNERAKAKLKEKWATMQNVYSSGARLDRVVEDIRLDFEIRPRLMNGRGNAILVADSILTACKYYESFVKHGFTGLAVISSYRPSPSDVATDAVSVSEDTEAETKFKSYLKMIGIDPGDDYENVAKKVDAFEEDAKKEFKESPAKMRLLIVVDKLLTGFDAPKCTYLYLDKRMHDHGLFQALCRVNRIDDESKDFGYVVDYQKLMGDITDAIEMYSSDAFKNYDTEDIEGLVKDIVAEASDHFKMILAALEMLCEGVKPPATGPEYREYFCGKPPLTPEEEVKHEQMRANLYSLVSALMRAYAQLKPRMADAGIDAVTAAEYEKKVTFYLALKKDIGLASGDFIDLKAYEPGMRYLIDTYIDADNAERLTILDDFTLLDFINQKKKDEDEGEGPKTPVDKTGVAETIENNAAKELVKKQAANPAFYAKMSQILKKLIDDRKAGVEAYVDLLEKYKKLAEALKDPEAVGNYPPSMKGEPLLQALYDNFGEDEALACSLHNAILGSKMPGFQFNQARQNAIKAALYEILEDEDLVEKAYAILAAQEGA